MLYYILYPTDQDLNNPRQQWRKKASWGLGANQRLGPSLREKIQGPMILGEQLHFTIKNIRNPLSFLVNSIIVPYENRAKYFGITLGKG